jgi:hypothetical protein
MAKKSSFYFDEMTPRPAATQLTRLGYEVTMAVDVGMVKKDDLKDHLPYATARGLVMVSQDRRFAGLAQRRSDHAGVICWTGATDDIGSLVRRLAEFAEKHSSEQVVGRVFWLK